MELRELRRRRGARHVRGHPVVKRLGGLPEHRFVVQLEHHLHNARASGRTGALDGGCKFKEGDVAGLPEPQGNHFASWRRGLATCLPASQGAQAPAPRPHTCQPCRTERELALLDAAGEKEKDAPVSWGLLRRRRRTA